MGFAQPSGLGPQSGPLFAREVVEAALAHVVGNKVEAAYQRGDMFEKRRRLMDAWAEFCKKASATAKIVPMRSS